MSNAFLHGQALEQAMHCAQLLNRVRWGERRNQCLGINWRARTQAQTHQELLPAQVLSDAMDDNCAQPGSKSLPIVQAIEPRKGVQEGVLDDILDIALSP